MKYVVMSSVVVWALSSVAVQAMDAALARDFVRAEEWYSHGFGSVTENIEGKKKIHCFKGRADAVSKLGAFRDRAVQLLEKGCLADLYEEIDSFALCWYANITGLEKVLAVVTGGNRVSGDVAQLDEVKKSRLSCSWTLCDRESLCMLCDELKELYNELSHINEWRAWAFKAGRVRSLMS